MPRKVLSLNDGIRRILYEHYDGKKAVKTATDRLYMVGEIIGIDKPLNKIDEDDISRVIQKCREQGNSNSTINRKLSVLSKLLRTAHVEWRVIDRVPYFRKLDEAPVDIHLVTKEEEATQLAFFKEHYPLMEAMYVCLIDTGCRLSEIRHLKRREVYWDDNLIRIVDDKAGRIRSVPMTKRVQAVLREWLIEKDLEQPFVKNTKSSYRHMWDMSRRILDKEGDKSFHIHCLRHTCATRLLKSGVTVPLVARWLGHSNLETTMRYLRLLPDDLREACQKMENF